MKNLFLVTSLLLCLVRVQAQGITSIPDQAIYPGSPYTLNVAVSKADSLATITAKLYYYVNGRAVEQPNQPALTRNGQLVSISWNANQTRSLPINQRLWLEIKAGTVIRQGAYVIVSTQSSPSSPTSYTYSTPSTIELATVPFGGVKDVPAYLSQANVESKVKQSDYLIDKQNTALSLSQKASQSDLTATNQTVAANALALGAKANQADLITTNQLITSNTAAIGLKANQSALDATNQNVTANTTALNTKSATIQASNYVTAASLCAALPTGVAAIVKVAADESPGNAGTGTNGANPTTYYLYFPTIGLIQQVIYPN